VAHVVTPPLSDDEEEDDTEIMYREILAGILREQLEAYQYIRTPARVRDYSMMPQSEKFWNRQSYARSKSSKLLQKEKQQLADARKIAQKAKSTDRSHDRKPGTQDRYPQSDVLDEVSTLGSIDIPDVALPSNFKTDMLRIVTLFLSLSQQTTTSGCLFSLSQFLLHYANDEMVTKVMQFAPQYLGLDVGPQAEDMEGEPTDTPAPPWVKLLRHVKTNWRGIINCEGFAKVSNLLSLLVTIGICDASTLHFTTNGITWFAPKMLPKHTSAVSLIDAVFETITYFVEAGHECFQAGSIKPLFYSDLDLMRFEKDMLRCEEYITYVQAGNLSKHTNLDENDFLLLLNTLKDQAVTLKATCTNPYEKKIVSDKAERLNKISAIFNQIRSTGGLRIAPYCTEIFGASGVGKSSVSQLVMEIVLRSNDFNADKERVCSLSESDKYDSNYRSHINGVYIDDIANTNSKFTQTAPTKRVIEFVNNMRIKANMAEVELKGKVEIEPKAVVLTTNVKDLCAPTYSNEPVSVLRRCKNIVTVSVKEKYATNGMLDQEKVRMHFTKDGVYTFDRYADLWNFRVEYAFGTTTKIEGKRTYTQIITYRPHIFEGSPMTQVDLATYLRFLAWHSRDHFKNQRELVENSNDKYRAKLCKCCHVPEQMCCMEAQSLLAAGVQMLVVPKMAKATACLTQCLEKVDLMCTKSMISAVRWLDSSPFTIWTNWIPEEWMENETIKSYVQFFNYDKVEERVRTLAVLYSGIVILLLTMSCVHESILCLLGAILAVFIGTAQIRQCEEAIYEQIGEQRDALPAMFKKHRDDYMQYVLGASVALAIVYTCAKAWKSLNTPVVQSTLEPTSMEEVQERDGAVNEWAKVAFDELPTSSRSKCVALSELEEMVAGNLTHVKITSATNSQGCDALFLSSNVALIPQHIMGEGELHATFTRKDPSVIGANFSCYISRTQSQLIPDTDFALVWVPNGGSWRNISHYLPVDVMKAGMPCTLVHKRVTGEVTKQNTMVAYNATCGNGTATSFEGYQYTLPEPTFNGLCMGTLVAQLKAPTIVGFHLGGSRWRTHFGVAGTVTQHQYAHALQELSNKPNVLITCSEGNLPRELFGIAYFEGQSCDMHSPMRFMEEGTNCKYYGSCKGKAKYMSKVRTSCISKHVATATGVENMWSGPKFKGPDGHSRWHPWRESLTYSTKPSIGVPADLLSRACEDFKQSFSHIRKLNPKLLATTRPLTEMETLCGIDGAKFIDKMQPSTSIGYPLGGPKSKYITYLEPSPEGTHQCPAVLDEIFLKHRDEIVAAYRRGERGHLIFKACLKDEPTPVTKDKVRVFQGAAVSLQLLARQYFLPLARVISLYPLKSECAVGVNAHGPDWQELHNYITRHGNERILAGDYSKYDLRMPAQLILSAFSVLEHVAKMCDYSEDDLLIMRGVASDIAYPVMAYDGDLIQMIGSNPSGHNLTVYINSLVNSLLFRCAFYDTYPDADVCMSKVCSIMTYGDDVKGSVHPDWPKFNHLTVRDFLARHDMKFTMPDKTSTPTAYMNDEDCDFLKRKSVYIPEIGQHVGALDEDSIFKSLHANIESTKETKEQVSASCLQSALGEWFAHGRQVYEMRREQMDKVAMAAGLKHMVPELTLDFDARVERWRQKYYPSEEGASEKGQAAPESSDDYKLTDERIAAVQSSDD
jgi:hypothetical protein